MAAICRSLSFPIASCQTFAPVYLSARCFQYRRSQRWSISSGTCSCFDSRGHSTNSIGRKPSDTLSDETRHIFSQMAQPIAIVTTALPETDTNGIHASARAITLSSLTCLSLNPDPLVTFNVKLPSRALDTMRQAQKLIVNLLLTYSESQVELARKFAQPMPAVMEAESTEAVLADIFDPAFWHVEKAQMGIPQLRHPGAAKLYCTVQQIMLVADHAIVVAKVDDTAKLVVDSMPALVYKSHQFEKVMQDE